MLIYKLLSVVLLCFVYDGGTVGVGDGCRYGGYRGACTPYGSCQSTQLARALGGEIQFCNVPGKRNIICCLDPTVNILIPFVSHFNYLANVFFSVTSATTPQPRPSTDNSAEPLFDGCRMDPKLTASKTGRKAWDKCIEYQQQLVYPCERSAWLQDQKVRVNRCAHAHQSTDHVARADEFPHMVVLGNDSVRWSTDNSLMYWRGVGTLISEQYILSDAHSWIHGPTLKVDPLYAMVGPLYRRTDNNEAYQKHRVESIIRYRPPYDNEGLIDDQQPKFHDIALLKTATVIRLNRWVVPACLDLSGGHLQAVATRWRNFDWEDSNKLLKVLVHQILSNKEYQEKMFPQVVDPSPPEHQIGYGFRYDPTNEDGTGLLSHDTGSLVVENKLVNCMYTVIAVKNNVGSLWATDCITSYTKVVNYASWIEETVWPEDN